MSYQIKDVESSFNPFLEYDTKRFWELNIINISFICPDYIQNVMVTKIRFYGISFFEIKVNGIKILIDTMY